MNLNFPAQALPMSKKNKEWRKSVVNWAKDKTLFSNDLVRATVINKKINCDLLNGILHMQDMSAIINPDGVQQELLPEKIQHYPIINSKLDVLIGEESSRNFDYRVVITNPTSISKIEDTKKQELMSKVQSLMEDQEMPEEEFKESIERLGYHYNYEWQDFREVRANALINHFSKEQNFPLLFNKGFRDALWAGEEIYQCDIIGGEPVVTVLNPMKVRIFKSGYSTKIEDADVVILEDYWQPGRIIDTYHEVLSPKDVKKIESNSKGSIGDGTRDRYDDPRDGFIWNPLDDGNTFFSSTFDTKGISSDLLPYDLHGNVRVLRVYWKSQRRIKKVKSYDQVTGEAVFNFYPENYQIDKNLGEEEEIFYINEAWEGTLIGDDIFVNMRPRPIQYNRLSNPSKCHFGIVGSIYSFNDDRPFSLVDKMKPYNYLYNVIHDRLNRAIAANWGKIIIMDLAKVPAGWDVQKWLYYAKTNKIAVIDSFKEGTIGASTGKIAGGLNAATTGVIDAETGNHIQQQISLLEYIKEEMAEMSGISKQREGQISNRETVGGIERATLQSSHITEWLFKTHDDTKKRVLECFLETAKIAMRGSSTKFQYLLSDGSMSVMDIDGDEFSENDYGLVVDAEGSSNALKQKIEGLAQAALQNQALSFSAIMKLYGSGSLAEKQRMLEKDEQKLIERRQQEQQAAQQSQEKIAQMQQEQAMAELKQKDELNKRDNDTKVLIAQMGMQKEMLLNNSSSEELKLNLEREKFEQQRKDSANKLAFEKQKHKDQTITQRMQKTQNKS